MANNNLFNISEFAKMSGINRSTLIYYDEIDLLKPTSRGENNYRLYSFHQLEHAILIASLKNLGVPLSEIKKYVEEESSVEVKDIFTEQLNKIDEQVDRLQQMKFIMSKYIENVDAYGGKITPSFELIQEPERIICVAPVSTDDENQADSILSFIQSCRENGVKYVNHIGRFYSMEQLQNRQIDGHAHYYLVSEKGTANRVGGALRLRPLTPPCVRFRTRRFNILSEQTLPEGLMKLSPIGGVFSL